MPMADDEAQSVFENFDTESITPLSDKVSPGTFTLSGDIIKVRYEAEDGSFAILDVRDGQGNIQCVVGNINGAASGQSIKVAGRWEQHKDYGRQLRADNYSFSLPVTREGIERYLSSGFLKGIGPKTAKQIVDVFGLDTLSVLDTAPKRLMEIPGFKKKRVDAIRKAWRENTDKRELRVFMEGLGITPAYFARIYKLYGDASADIVKADPYRLASEVDGIGFLLADRIGEKLNIGKNDVKRLVSGVSFTLGEMRSAGHVCVPRYELVKALCEKLSIDEAEAEKAVDEAIANRKAVFEFSSTGHEMIYDPALKRCEDELPKVIFSLLNAVSHAASKIAKIAPEDDARFSSEQLEAVLAVAHSPVSIITGGPGVGKTTVISEIVRRAKKAKIDFALAAPTGRAAKRMSEATGVAAFTIHRLLKWDPVKGGFVHGKDDPLPYKLIIVDESSMLDILIALALFRAIKQGTTLVIVGDPDQLPSVGPGNVLNDLIDSRLCPVSRLTKIFRQGAGSGIIEAAHMVNSGFMPRRGGTAYNGELSDFYWIEKETPEEAADVISRLVTERIPSRFGFDPVKDIQILTPMNRGLVGTASLNNAFQSLLNTESKLVFKSGERLFKKGDRVMQISNNYDKGVFNGDMGIIKAIDYANESFSIKFDTQSVDYAFTDASQIVLAYAVTVHKSQGSEFPAVVMPIMTQHFMMLQRNLLYTAITRAKRLMILVGSAKAVGMAVRNTVREPRYSLLPEKLLKITG